MAEKGKKAAASAASPASDANEKKKALDVALASIEKQFGKGAVIRMGDTKVRNIEVISTGCLDLDMALGVGGLPRGRVVEIYGPESSGKTTVALHVVAEAQKKGGVAAFIDAEHALDPIYAKKLGVDVDQLYVSQPDTGEQALEITEALVRSGAIDVVVIDSVAALVPKQEIDGEMGDSHVGLQARRQEQGGSALPGGGIRYPLWRGNQQGGQPAGQCDPAGCDPQVRCLVLLRGFPDRAGTGECAQIPEGKSRVCQRSGKEGPGSTGRAQCVCRGRGSVRGSGARRDA